MRGRRRAAKPMLAKKKKKTDSDTSMWTQLPKVIIGLILERLNVVDYVRFGAVCVSWKSVVAEKSYHPSSGLRWIMLSYHPESNIRGFFSLSDGKEYKLNLPEARNAWCCGSSHGWMIMTHKERGNFLLNPFSGNQIQLPSIHTRDIHKAILSSAPTQDNIRAGNCIVVAVYDDYETAYCRPRDESWTSLRELSYDIIFYKGLLHALNERQLTVWELGSSPKEERCFFLPAGVELHYHRLAHLVESNEELLLVIMLEDPCGVQINGFRVHKLDASSNNWLVVESLGEWILFLGSVFWRRQCSTGSISLKAMTNLLALGFKEDCIYFSEGKITCPTSKSSCTFLLANGRIERDLPSVYLSFQFTPIWVTPDLW